MRFRSLIFINSFLVGAAIAGMNFYFQRSWADALLTLAISFLLGYILFYYFFERYIREKIKIIYKLIHNLKLGKELKGALGNTLSDDPINDVEHEVREWARSKKIEIDALKSQEKFRREFLTNISHEFKTPLFAIQGYIDALQEGMMEEDPDMAKQFLNKASDNLDRLTYLIQDLDEISKLESGRVPMNFDFFDLPQLILEVMDSLEAKAQQHKITLIFKEKYQEPTDVYADREKIRQVLVNLIDNSIKYGVVGGHTYLRVFPMFDHVLVEVTDDGTGIDEKNLSRVFERFFRTDKSRSRKIGGSGLGLSIVKHIIEAHEQTINVRSTEGLGTTFGFTLSKKKASG